jgi:3-dehydroquinate dehydratase
MTDFFKNPQTQNLMKIHPVGVEMFHAADGQTEGRMDRRTDTTKLIVSFHNFSKASKNQISMCI